MNPTLEYLELLAGFQQKQTLGPVLAQWLLDNGRDFGDRAPLPARVKMRPPKQCYRNALSLAARSRGRYVYCEGVATSIIPLDHAWCYDNETGLVVDTTWDTGRAYFGVPVKLGYARRRLEDNGAILPTFRKEYCIAYVPPEVWREEI